MPIEAEAMIVAPSSTVFFAELLSRRLGAKLALLEETKFSDGEMKFRLTESCERRPILLIHSLFHQSELGLHDKFLELLFLAQSLRDASAGHLTAVVPYLCYARQDRQVAWQDPVTSRYVAELLEASGIRRVLTMDVHNLSAFQNSFRIPTLHLTAAPLLADHVSSEIKGEEVAVVSPDIGGVKRAEAFREILAKRMKADIEQAYVIKRRKGKVVTEEAFLGDVRGKTAIIFDDMISTGATIARAAEACHVNGAKKVLAVATHGIFAKGIAETLAGAGLDGVIVGNTVLPLESIEPRLGDIARRIDVSPVFAEGAKSLGFQFSSTSQ